MDGIEDGTMDGAGDTVPHHFTTLGLDTMAGEAVMCGMVVIDGTTAGTEEITVGIVDTVGIMVFVQQIIMGQTLEV